MPDDAPKRCPFRTHRLHHDGAERVLQRLETLLLKGLYRAKAWPAAVLFVEAEGQYSLSREVETRRFNSIYALVARFYLTPMDRDTKFVELRYENGFKRGSTSEGRMRL